MPSLLRNHGDDCESIDSSEVVCFLNTELLH